MLLSASRSRLAAIIYGEQALATGPLAAELGRVSLTWSSTLHAGTRSSRCSVRRAFGIKVWHMCCFGLYN